MRPAVNSRSSSVTLLPPEELFSEIVRLYDLAENIVASVQKEGITNREVQFELAKPLITQLTNSANILTAFYTEIERNGKPVTLEMKDTFESAFRNIVFAYREFLDGVEEKLLPGKEGI